MRKIFRCIFSICNKLKKYYSKENTTTMIDLKKQNNFLCINVPKKEAKGEDANPIVLQLGDMVAVGVFDGMGGAGATEYVTINGTHTGAYIASREVKKTVEDYMRSANCVINSQELTSVIQKKLTDCVVSLGIKPSGLRSSIIKTLPTTLAFVIAKKEEKNTNIKSYWCGDSRNYILTKTGLQQISIDDLVNPQDPLENLRNDEALSNCVSQDKSFKINEKEVVIREEPSAIISATDGCFGYLSTPMHFEYILLKSLNKANDCEDWKKLIEEELVPISGDDFSLGLVLMDVSFEEWKILMQSRLDTITSKYIDVYQNKKYAIDEAERKLKEAHENLHNSVTKLWEDYKKDYMKL